jgi:hypothetical protein
MLLIKRDQECDNDLDDSEPIIEPACENSIDEVGDEDTSESEFVTLGGRGIGKPFCVFCTAIRVRIGNNYDVNATTQKVMYAC